ncbi:MAG: hypothetical protein WCJ74_00850 [bacterium]
MILKNIAEIGSLAKGFHWQSAVKMVGDIRFILFALATGDWNKIHINPFTAWRYKSNLKGLTCCGDFVLALTKPGIHKMFRFIQDVEIIALGYTDVELKHPLHLGMYYQYSYTLDQCLVRKNRTYCTWLIEMKSLEGDIIAKATWKMFYVPVERRTFVTPVLQALREFIVDLWQHPVRYFCLSTIIAIITFLCFHSQFPSLCP